MSRVEQGPLKRIAKGGAAIIIAGAGTLGLTPPDTGQALNQALNNFNPRNTDKTAQAGAFSIIRDIRLIRDANAQRSFRIMVSILPSNESMGTIPLNYDIGPGVSNADIQFIRDGIRLAQNELESHYGGDIQRPVNNPMTVKVVATGQGNQELGGKGACCTALDESGARPFFDVMHPGYPRIPTDRKIAAGHEYTHAWQNALGCLTIHDQPLGGWVNEGIAQYVPLKGFIRAGIINNEVTRYQQYYGAKSTGELNVPLQSLDTPEISVWPGHVGYLAIDRLVSQAPSRLLSLRQVCESIATGSSVDQAFQGAFGQSRTDFYRDFPAYLQSLRTSPIYLTQAGRLPQGSVPSVPANSVAYEFNFVAYGFEDLTSNQQTAAWQFPPQACAWGGSEAGKWEVALCNASPGTYPIRIQMPDGRSAQVGLVHTN